jgi:hydroxyacylglutathione hydrolase
LERDEGLLYSGDTLFAGAWGRTDFPGGDAEAMVASLARLTGLEDHVGVFPGHGAATTIGRERAWMELVRDQGRLFA